MRMLEFQGLSLLPDVVDVALTCVHVDGAVLQVLTICNAVMLLHAVKLMQVEPVPEVRLYKTCLIKPTSHK